MPTLSNFERASRGRQALAIYSQETTDVALVDLLADLLHLADQEGMRWAQIRAAAEDVHGREVEEELAEEVKLFLPDEGAHGGGTSQKPADHPAVDPEEAVGPIEREPDPPLRHDPAGG